MFAAAIFAAVFRAGESDMARCSSSPPAGAGTASPDSMGSHEEGVVDVVVVGGGLSGLVTADTLLRAEGVSVRVLECRDRVGGRARVLSTAEPFDLGAAWIWVQQNHNMVALTKRLGIETYPTKQLYDSVYETRRGGVQRVQNRQHPIDDGERRMVGGAQAVADDLARGISKHALGSIALGTTVHKLIHRASSRVVEVHYSDGDGEGIVRARSVVVCMPPRLVPEQIAFEPPLPLNLVAALGETRTWMAQQGKAIVAYPHAFWEEARFSGEARSEVGPLEWITNCAITQRQRPALCGFLTHDKDFRAAPEEEQKKRITAQLVRLFGPRAAEDATISIFDWAREPATCSTRDVSVSDPWRHPDYRRYQPLLAAPQWAGACWFAGSETSAQNAGYLDGAVAAGLARAKELLKSGVLKA
eukprot:TRINITY_DN2226_c3_g1_i1.p1 TRINITY_DN2226_c3_g1~~TRINITY_DN2226_c3_g1_i1.p1  ORF type:complete len:416 (+),score=74.23 TRINITY_DN2226_c3_g1_i1:41-1288(+)